MPRRTFHFHVVRLQIHWCLENKGNISSVCVWCWGSGPTCECWFCLWGTWDWPHPGLRCCWSVCFHHWWQLWWQARGRKGFSPAESKPEDRGHITTCYERGISPIQKKKEERNVPLISKANISLSPCATVQSFLTPTRPADEVKLEQQQHFPLRLSPVRSPPRPRGWEKKKKNTLQTGQSSVSKRSAQLKLSWSSAESLHCRGCSEPVLTWTHWSFSTKQQSSQTQQDVAFTHSNTTGGSHGNLPINSASHAMLQLWIYMNTA